MPKLRSVVVMGALGAGFAAYVRARRSAPEPEEAPALPHEHNRPFDEREGLGSESAATLETDGRHVTDPELAEVIQFPDDATLLARVESELFRDPELPKGAMNLDAAGGVVTLRGEVDAAVAEDVATRVAAVDGVVRVENLLHAPGTPPPHVG